MLHCNYLNMFQKRTKCQAAMNAQAVVKYSAIFC
jgi:hypothetical protein